MAKRAFIIAIENYEQMQEGLDKTLPNTHKHALAFRSWLIDTLKLDEKDIFFCTEDATLAGRTAGATRQAVRAELKRLRDAAQDSPEDLLFYFSGHGFCYTDIDDIPTADVLLFADYTTRDDASESCLKLDEIQKWLRMCLGVSSPGGTAPDPGHYYFIDACRNNVSERDVKVGSLGLNYQPSSKKKPPIYTLYSSTTGTLAAADESFPTALLEGLNGRGRAKRRYQQAYAVLFDALRTYIEQRLNTELDERTESGRDGVIRLLDGALQYECAISIDNAEAADEFDVEVMNDRQQTLQQLRFTFSGKKRSFKAPPDDYYVRVRLVTPVATDMVMPDSPVHADLYENCALTYAKEAVRFRGINLPRGGPPPPPAPRAEPPDTLAPPAPPPRDIPRSPLRRGLLRAIPGHHTGDAVDFSETLGPMRDQGLDMWLAIIGASRITGGPDDYSKLGPLPLTTFQNVAPGEAPFYVLAGFDQPYVDFRAVLAPHWEWPPVPVPPHPVFPNLFEMVEHVSGPAHRYLTVQVDQSAPVTVGVCSLPNRATLVTVTRDATGSLRIQQFMFTLKGRGVEGFPGVTELDAVSTPLRLARRCVEVQRAFAKSQDIGDVLSASELEFLLYFKWWEPIVAVLAAYELVRRGELGSLPTVVNNLRGFFGGLPDTEALAKLAGLGWTPPSTPPLVLEGFQALDLMEGDPRIPPGNALLFRGPWTMWRGLV